MRRVESRKGRSGFTLIELLVVVAIIALLISILLPSLARARELAKRTTCAANMSGIGKGLHTYASDGNQGMPIAAAAAATDSTGAVGQTTYVRMIGSKRGSSNNPSLGETYPPAGTSGTSQISTARNLWTLIRSGGSTPGSFVCPSSEDNKNDEDNPQDYWDFGKGDSTAEGTLGNGQGSGTAAAAFGWKQVSYGYQVPYGQFGKPSAEGDQRAVLSADKGPYGVFLDAAQGSDPQDPINVTSTSSPDDWRKYNSPNHGGIGDGEGQNVLFADSHADWANKPTAGPALDNIYTQWGAPNTTDPLQRIRGKRPQTNQTPYANTDGLIYP